MKQRKFRVLQQDYIKANRRASRQEEIALHGHPVHARVMSHKSKRTYDRNRLKRAAIWNDDSPCCFL